MIKVWRHMIMLQPSSAKGVKLPIRVWEKKDEHEYQILMIACTLLGKSDDFTRQDKTPRRCEPLNYPSCSGLSGCTTWK